VPDDIALAGFGDFEVGRVSTPSLTTISVDTALLAEEIAGVVIAALGDAKSNRAAAKTRDVPYAVRRGDSAPSRTPKQAASNPGRVIRR
jgi:LacI family gluconate utilization system Gnt-I transcriptional repressor